MHVQVLPIPEKFDQILYCALTSIAPRIRGKGGESLRGFADPLDTERPMVLALAAYAPISGGEFDCMVLAKWNDEIYEYALCEFAPYKPTLKTNDTDAKSVWESIGKFTDKNREVGAIMLMIRAGLPKE